MLRVLRHTIRMGVTALGLLALLGVSSCSGEKYRAEKSTAAYDAPQLEAGTMLVDYFRAIQTAAGEEYHELVLSAADDPEWVWLDAYAKEPDEAEICIRYLVPAEAAEYCFAEIGLAEKVWNGPGGDEPESPDGVRVVCKYYRDGTCIRITSDETSSDGYRHLETIGALLGGYRLDEYRIDEEAFAGPEEECSLGDA